MSRKRKLHFIKRIRSIRDSVLCADNTSRKKRLLLSFPHVAGITFTSFAPAECQLDDGTEFITFQAFQADQANELAVFVYRYIINNKL